MGDNEQFCQNCGMMVSSPSAPELPHEGGKRLISKPVAYAIAGIALIVIILITGISAVRNFIIDHGGRSVEDRLDGYFDDRDDAMPWEYFDDRGGFDDRYDDYYDDYYDYYGHGGDHHGYYGGMPYGGVPGGNSAPSGATPAPSPDMSAWPADENGKYPNDNDYKWPSGDGKYEYYNNSTIPKYESVTGAELIKAETENGNTYYTYKADDKAYDEYIKAIKDRGFKQSEFEVKGKNSYETYKLGDDSFYEYLIIYRMNTDGEIVIMA